MIRQRRHLLTGALAGLTGLAGRAGRAAPAGDDASPWTAQALQRLDDELPAASAADRAALRRLAEDGESRLARGDTAGARAAFEAAAGRVHSADVEMALVRCAMQAGAVRHALAFAAHVAGAHHDVPGATALYAWLLQLVGQGRVAERLLAAALRDAPRDAALLAARDALAGPWPQAQGPLLAPPLRAAPYALAPADGSRLPRGARVAGSAVLGADGLAALVPAATLQGLSSPWLRNGLGQTVAAVAQPLDGVPGMLRLQLQARLPWPPGLAASPRDPFAGSPGCLVEYADRASADAAWPLLRPGFFGRQAAAGAARSLGIDRPAGPRGGPVFDAQGRLAGIALPGRGGPDGLLSAATLGPLWGPPAAAVTGAARADLDQVYAASLLVALQVIVPA